MNNLTCRPISGKNVYACLLVANVHVVSQVSIKTWKYNFLSGNKPRMFDKSETRFRPSVPSFLHKTHSHCEFRWFQATTIRTTSTVNSQSLRRASNYRIRMASLFSVLRLFLSSLSSWYSIFFFVVVILISIYIDHIKAFKRPNSKHRQIRCVEALGVIDRMPSLGFRTIRRKIY